MGEGWCKKLHGIHIWGVSVGLLLGFFSSVFFMSKTRNATEAHRQDDHICLETRNSLSSCPLSDQSNLP